MPVNAGEPSDTKDGSPRSRLPARPAGMPVKASLATKGRLSPLTSSGTEAGMAVNAGESSGTRPACPRVTSSGTEAGMPVNVGE